MYIKRYSFTKGIPYLYIIIKCHGSNNIAKINNPIIKFLGINISFSFPAKICIARTEKNTIKKPNRPEHNIDNAQKIYVPIQYFVLLLSSFVNIAK